MILIQWDDQKQKSNIEKHGVAFDEAATVFSDENAIEFYDLAHSDKEDRFFIVGKSILGRLLIGVYSHRRSKNGKEEYFRIISARIANKNERQAYSSQN